MFFNPNKKKQLYILGKQFYSYNRPKSNFTAPFTKMFPLDIDKYKRKKYLTLKRYLSKDDKVTVNKYCVDFWELINALRKSKHTWKDIAKLTKNSIKPRTPDGLRKGLERFNEAMKKENKENHI